MKIFKGILLFFIVFLVGQFILVQVGETFMLKSNFRFSQLYNENKSVDAEVLCFGNSRGVNSFYSPYLNDTHDLKSLNMSYNGVELSISKLLIEDYLDRHQKPEVIFIEISSLFNNSQEPINFKSFSLYSGKSERFQNEINKDLKDKAINKLLPLLNYNSELFHRTLYYLNRDDQTWINDYRISSALIEQVKASKSVSFEINEKELFKLKSLLEVLKEKEIKVFPFVAPYLDEYREKITNLQSQISVIEKKLNSEIINLSSFLNDPKYFADRIHTNKQGAILISERLLQNIEGFKPQNQIK